jgi:hypothetical protein
VAKTLVLLGFFFVFFLFFRELFSFSHCFTVYIHNGTFPLKYALRDTLGISNGSFVMKRMSTSGKARKEGKYIVYFALTELSDV